ncbi:MAG: (deoxy)nucleoside triphosphate pyrophosphohydrolase [Acidimicrobiia bacterium]|nr:(deoxy)nucleoside triphosphate pyrophosphohydrolase [Acidimicrobiia bacterium]
MTVVVAALIERDGKLLIAQRRAEERHGLQWEFPGGKAEPGEGAREALKRELEEELGIQAEIGEEIERYQYQYPGCEPIELMFFRVDAYQGEPANRVFERIVWERPARLPDYDFLEGDVEFVRRLASGEAGVKY